MKRLDKKLLRAVALRLFGEWYENRQIIKIIKRMSLRTPRSMV